MKYAEYIEAARACCTDEEAAELIETAAADWKLSARQYETIRHTALQAVFEWFEYTAQ